MFSLLVLVLLVSNAAGLRISFGENDYAARESKTNISVVVTKSQENSGDIVVRVIPVTVKEYKQRFDFEALPNSLKSIVNVHDPAEAGDFSSEIHNITFLPSGSQQAQSIAIQVTDDTTEEPEEVFLVYLEVAHISDEDKEDLEPDTSVTVARIRLDNDMVEVTLGFTEELLEIQEGEAADVCVRLEPAGDVEISLRIFTRPGNATVDEHYIPISQDLFLSSAVPMECVTMVTEENVIAELPRTFTVELEDKYPVVLHHLEPHSVTVFITDDDGLQIGFGQIEYVASEPGQIVLEITKTGQSSGSITVRVTPVTVEDYTTQFNENTLPNAVKNLIDAGESAEVSDFSGVSHDIIFPVGGDDTRQAIIGIVDDLTDEPVEVFLVYLEVFQANDQDAGNVELTRSVSVGSIQDDDSVSIGFSESMVSLPEGSSSLSVDIVRTGVTVKVLEISLDVSSDGSATRGIDFEITQTEISLEPSAAQTQVSFSILDDALPERTETFTVNIRSSADYYIGGLSTLTVEIVDDDAVIVGLTNDPYVEVEEGETFEVCAAILNPEVDVELNLHIFTVPGNASADHYTTFSHHLSLNNGKNSECFTVETVENDKTELPSTFTITLEADTNTHVLHQVQPNSVTVVITDDDTVRVGFAPSQTQSVQEGGTIDVCVAILEPKEVDIEIQLCVLVQGNAKEDEQYIPFTQELLVSGETLSDCITITTIENDKIEQSHVLTLTLQDKNPSSQHLNINPSLITVIITDDDGVPKLPQGIKIELVNDNKDLFIQWEVPQTELQPVSSFIVIVRSEGDTRRQSNERVYETQQTNLTIVGIDLNSKYVIQICAKNMLGYSCSEEMTFSSVIYVPPTSEGLPHPEGTELDVPGIVLIVLALPVFISLLCCVMMLIVFWVCCRPSEARKYYPQLEEHRHTKEYVLSLKDIFLSSLSPSTTEIDSNIRTRV